MSLCHKRLFRPPLQNQQGAALLIVLILVVIMGLGAGIAGTTWDTITQRAREQELLFRGEEYRKAIESYFVGNNVGQKGSLPGELKDLLKDPRALHTVRHLRKLYPDPMTGKEWFVIRNNAKRIIGVRSTSTRAPFKKEGFDKGYEAFANAETYQNWEFVYNPESETKASEETSPSPFSPSPFVATPFSES
ncbi:MAG: type II secretion system protein [Deltaproteobacteria bacterium]|nr:type II secretion system protein [Deltaproteobacteria bacterium]